MDCAALCYARLYGDVEKALRQLCIYGVLYDRRHMGLRILERCIDDPCNAADCECRCGKIGDPIYDALADVGAATAGFIAKRIGRNYYAVVRRLEELAAQGLVDRRNCGGVTLYSCAKRI